MNTRDRTITQEIKFIHPGTLVIERAGVVKVFCDDIPIAEHLDRMTRACGFRATRYDLTVEWRTGHELA